MVALSNLHYTSLALNGQLNENSLTLLLLIEDKELSVIIY